ncbi:MAG: hypothetical protein WCS88_02055 [Patescibacteria group bacterium]
MKKLVVFTVAALFCCLVLVILSGCGSGRTKVEKERIAQMCKELRQAERGDLLEMSDGSIALVSDNINTGLMLEYMGTNRSRVSHEALSERVIRIYDKSHPERCEAFEKFVASSL